MIFFPAKILCDVTFRARKLIHAEYNFIIYKYAACDKDSFKEIRTRRFRRSTGWSSELGKPSVLNMVIDH